MKNSRNENYQELIEYIDMNISHRKNNEAYFEEMTGCLMEAETVSNQWDWIIEADKDNLIPSLLIKILKGSPRGEENAVDDLILELRRNAVNYTKEKIEKLIEARENSFEYKQNLKDEAELDKC